MLRKIFFSTALVAAVMLLFAGLASAQDKGSITPTATIGEQVLHHPRPGVLKSPFRLMPKVGTLQPTYCSPCLFYAGDSNPTSPSANGLWDNNSAFFGISGVIYTPFLVTKPAHCGGVCDTGVTGIGGNIEYFPFPPSITGVDWSIVKGVAAGGTPSSTTVICSGTDSAPVLTDTGRFFFGFYEEFATAASTGGACPALETKKGGTIYWQTNAVDTTVFQLAYESNVPDVPPPNAFGNPEPRDDSFFYSPAFGFATFTPATNLGAFDVFSTFLEGSIVK